MKIREVYVLSIITLILGLSNLVLSQDISFNEEKNDLAMNVEDVPENLPANIPLTNSYKGNYIMIGTGIGMSYGIIGFRFQQRFGSHVGFGYHLGAGYLPDSPLANLSFSGGIKFFPYHGLYLNAQFGIIGWEHDEVSKEDINQIGISFLTGGDWVWGDKTGFGINFGLGFSYHLTGNDYDITPAGDLGFIIRF